MLRRLFLPLGLVLALTAGLLLPGPGRFLHDLHLIKGLVALIFLISGHQASPTTGPGYRQGLILAAAVLLTLFLAPLLGLLLARSFPLSPGMALGLTVMAAVPPTLSSGVVMTAISGGNTALALLLTVGLNLAGILTLPLVLGILLHCGPVHLDRVDLLLTLVLLVLVPFLFGRGLRQLFPPRPDSSWPGYLSSLCVILVVYLALAAERDSVFPLDREYPTLISAALLFHLLLLTISLATARLLRLTVQEQKAVVFVCSQKTLPLALAALSCLPAAPGRAAVACLLLHFLQLVVDSFLAGRWQE